MYTPCLMRVAIFCVAFSAIPASLHAETIESTISNAYDFNPTIKSSREQVEGSKENISEAESGFKPTISFDYDLGKQSNNFNGANSSANINNYALNIEQPLFNGLGDVEAVKRARLQVEIAKLTSQQTTQQILLRAALAHINLIRDTQIVEKSIKNESYMRLQHEDVVERQTLGALTKTDVSQATSRLAEAEADTYRNRSLLNNSQNIYFELIGALPENSLLMPKAAPSIPKSLDECLENIEQKNTELKISKLNIAVAEKQITEARSTFSPNISLKGAITKDHSNGTFGNQNLTNHSIYLNLNVPIYTAGKNLSKVRRTKSFYKEAQYTHTAALHNIKRQINSSWNALSYLQKSIEHYQISL